MIAFGSEDTTFHRGRLDVFLYFNTRVSWFGLFSFGRLSLVIFARYPCSTSAMVLLQAYMWSERGCGRYRTCSGIDVRGGAEQNTGARYWAVVNASGADDDSEPTYHLHNGSVVPMPGYELSV